jgi:phosphopantothenoylcysteine decarboxylase / phosphopantothenate---cysteine ligase
MGKMKENKDLKVDIVDDYLKGKSIALCITGGIAAIETPKLARQLRRYGADVTAYMTDSAQKFIGETSLEWATEKKVVTKLSGLAEHICTNDLVLVAPATLNTTNKIFAGIADNNVTTLAASALGQGIPVYLAPTMHMSLYNNPIFQKNITNAEEFGIDLIEPRFNEGKAKFPSIDRIVADSSRELSNHSIKGKNVLITGGPTPGEIDDVRIITNRFSGALALFIAKEAYYRGADVKLLLGQGGVNAPNYIDTSFHKNYDQYCYNVFKSLLEKKFDAGIFSAAVADYIPEQKMNGKIPSHSGLKNIPLKETKKVIKAVREEFPELFMATFKYEIGITKEKLFEIADSRIKEGYEMVVANRKEDMIDSHHAFLFGKEGLIYEGKSKKDIARKLIDEIASRLKNGTKKENTFYCRNF